MVLVDIYGVWYTHHLELIGFLYFDIDFFFFFLVFFHYFYSRRFKHVFSSTVWNKTLGKVLHLTLLWKEKKSTLGTKNEKTLLSLLLLLLPKLPSTSSDLQNNTRNIFAIWTDNYPINNHLIKKGQHQDTLLDLPNLHLCWTLGLCFIKCEIHWLQVYNYCVLNYDMETIDSKFYSEFQNRGE